MELIKTLEKIKSYLLQGAYQGAEHVLDGAIVEAESIQSECETLRVRVGEMAAEIERLQGVIDEANAQEPVYFWREIGEGDWMLCRKDWYFKCADSADHDAKMLYEKPIPAQQAPDAIKLLQRVAASTSDSIAAQQSPAVAVPDDKHILFLAEKFMPSTYLASENKAILFFAKECIGEAQSMQQPVILDKSPRITEQDERDLRRYRWLRDSDNFPMDDIPDDSIWDHLCEKDRSEFDEFIDLMMSNEDAGAAELLNKLNEN